jgi:hypothetical protein
MTLRRRFPLKTSLLVSLLVVALGTGAGVGVKSASVRRGRELAIAAIDANKPRALTRIRASEERRLTEGPLPIEKAMEELTSKGRMGLPTELLPLASADLAPLAGWAFLPHDVPEWMLGGPDSGAR